MARVIVKPTLIKAEGTRKKKIEEFVGRVNSGTTEISIARMLSAEGWEEPGQCPEFGEYTLVLKGSLQVETKTGIYTVDAGQAFIAYPGEWVKYSTPATGGAEYIAVCLPAFAPDTVHRD